MYDGLSGFGFTTCDSDIFVALPVVKGKFAKLYEFLTNRKYDAFEQLH